MGEIRKMKHTSLGSDRLHSNQLMFRLCFQNVEIHIKPFGLPCQRRNILLGAKRKTYIPMQTLQDGFNAPY